MAEASSKTKTWVVIITLLGLSAVMAYLFSPAGEATWGEPDTPDHPEEERPVRRAAAIGPHPDDPSPARAAAARPLPSNDAGPAVADLPPALGLPAPAVPEAVAPEQEQVPPAPHVSPHPVVLAEQTPEHEHNRALFIRDLLAQRIEDTRAAAAAARAEGNPNRAARLERQADRLAGQLPHANQIEAEHAARAEEARAEEARQSGEGETAGDEPGQDAVGEEGWNEEEPTAELPVW